MGAGSSSYRCGISYTLQSSASQHFGSRCHQVYPAQCGCYMTPSPSNQAGICLLHSISYSPSAHPRNQLHFAWC
jgi:hypothetical protein